MGHKKVEHIATALFSFVCKLSIIRPRDVFMFYHSKRYGMMHI